MLGEVTRRASDYETTVDGAYAGLIAFVRRDGATVITHTEIHDAYGGRGIGGQLSRAALNGLRRRGSTVVPNCPFTKSWIDKPPDYAEPVA